MCCKASLRIMKSAIEMLCIIIIIQGQNNVETSAFFNNTDVHNVIDMSPGHN